MSAKRLNIGITIGETNDGSGMLWNNGIAQNVIFLALLLQRLESVSQVALITCPGSPTHPLGTMFGLPVVPFAAAIESLDIIIELGARAGTEQQIERLKQRGGKLVSYVAGNVMVMNLEEIARGVPHGEIITHKEFDAVWVTPQHWHTCHSYLEMMRSPNTVLAPHIWDPISLNLSRFASGKNIFWRPPENDKYVLGCFDPNINVVKTFHIPLLLTEEAYRIDGSRIERILLFSALKFKETAHFNQLVNALDIGRAKKVFVESRHRLADVLGSAVHAVVTHQWENDLNYLYWETLYSGWPLIHNSAAIKDVGYYYNDFDSQEGGRQLTYALGNHLHVREKQRDAIRETLWRYSVDNPVVQQQYSDLIEKVMQS